MYTPGLRVVYQEPITSTRDSTTQLRKIYLHLDIVWQLITSLEKEEALAQTKTLHFERETYYQKYKNINDGLETIIHHYNEVDKLAFIQ